MTERVIKVALLVMVVLAATPMRSWNALAEPDIRLTKIAELKEEYTKRVNSATTAEAQGEYEAIIERLGIAEQLIVLENNGQAHTDEAQALLAQMLEGVPTEAENTIDADASTQSKKKYTYTTYTTTSQTMSNCHTQNTDFGKATGSVTAYTDSSYLVTTSVYPSYISDGTVGQCENTSFDKTVVVYNLVIDPKKACIHEVTSSSTGTMGKKCDKFGMGSLLFIAANAFYDDEAFQIPNAFTFLVI